MGDFRYYLLGSAKRTGKNGDWFIVNLNVTVTAGDNSRDYTAEVYTDAVIYGKAQGIQKFAEVDCIFVPNSRGKAVLVSLEAL